MNECDNRNKNNRNNVSQTDFNRKNDRSSADDHVHYADHYYVEDTPKTTAAADAAEPRTGRNILIALLALLVIGALIAIPIGLNAQKASGPSDPAAADGAATGITDTSVREAP